MGFSAFPRLVSQPRSGATETKRFLRGIRGHLETLLFCSVCLVPRADLGQDSGASFAPELTNQETFPSAVNCLKGHSRFLSLWLSAPCWGERPVRMEGQLSRKKCGGGRRGGCAGRGGAEFRQPPPTHTHTSFRRDGRRSVDGCRSHRQASVLSALTNTMCATRRVKYLPCLLFSGHSFPARSRLTVSCEL